MRFEIRENGVADAELVHVGEGFAASITREVGDVDRCIFRQKGN